MSSMCLVDQRTFLFQSVTPINNTTNECRHFKNQIHDARVTNVWAVEDVTSEIYYWRHINWCMSRFNFIGWHKDQSKVKCSVNFSHPRMSLVNRADDWNRKHPLLIIRIIWTSVEAIKISIYCHDGCPYWKWSRLWQLFLH